MRRNQSRNLTYGLVDKIGHDIVTGVYSPQNPFPTEAALCKQHNASRSVLREAVKMLTSKGMLRARPRQGTWIEPEENWNLLDPDILRWLLERKFSPRLLIEFTEIRLAIEPAAAALAARRADPVAIARIADALARMRAAERGEDDPLESDIAFHVSILKASGNRFYDQLRDIIEAALRISIRLTNQRKGVRLASVADHQKIADAIAAADPDLAAATTRALLSEVLDLIRGGEGAAGGA